MNKSIAVIGLGRYGKSIATELYKNGADVLVIDENPEIVNEIADSVTCAMSLDVCDMDALRSRRKPGRRSSIPRWAATSSSSSYSIMNGRP